MRLKILTVSLTVRLVVWLTGTPGAHAADQAYLPVVGPPPLRFALPAVTVDSESRRTELPPLPILNPPAAASLTEPGAPSTNAAAAEPSAILQASSGANTNAAASTSPSPLAAEAEPADGAGSGFLLPGLPTPVGTDANSATIFGQAPGVGPLTPQLFMKYFTPNGSHPSHSGVSAIVPVSFIPPEPVRLPSSSAAFETTPPGKP